MSITDLIHDPPSWFVAALIAVLTAHAIDKLIEFVTKRKSHNGLIPILELFIVFVLGFIAVHSYYEGMLSEEAQSAWYDRPFAVVVALVLYGLGSIALYIVSRAPSMNPAERNRGGSSRRIRQRLR